MMGWLLLDKPGDEYGPCKDENCGHSDCAASRNDAALICPHCGESIGYETKYYIHENGRVLVHALCEWKANSKAVRP